MEKWIGINQQFVENSDVMKWRNDWDEMYEDDNKGFGRYRESVYE